VGVLHAAELEPALENNLLRADATQTFSVIVKLYNPRNIQALDQELHARHATLADRHRIVIHALHQNAAATQGPVVARLEAMKAQGLVEGYTAYWIENLIVVSGKAEAMQALATDPAVESVGYNFKAALIDPVARGPIRQQRGEQLDNDAVTVGQRATGAQRVNRELGITGRGRLIAGLDTGVDGTHPALHDRWRGLTHPHAECWLDVLGTGTQTPNDGGGHGTHTMGTMTGRAFLPNGDTLTIGAAPDAEWIACNAINQGVGSPFTQDVLDAFQWLADPDGDSTTVADSPDVVHNSWGVTTSMPGYGACFNNWNTAILNCEAAGTVVTWSAGNEGPSAQTLRSPATFELSPTDMFSIGAVDLSADSTPPYPIAGFSSRGPSGCAPNTNAIKPEVVAPGVHVISSVPGTGYQYMDGTSMAGPHVAGIVALMREACPNCDPQTIKEALINTANDSGYVPAGENNTFGHGMVDAYAAVVSISSLGRVDGYVTLANGNPLAGVQVQATGQPGTTLTNTAGYYNLVVVQEGTYSVNYTKFGYQTITQNNVQIVAGDTVHLSQTMAPTPSGVLLGTVVLQSGVPVQFARVNFPGTPLDTLTTDAAGQFVQILPANPYNVHITFTINLTPPRTVNADTVVTVTAGDTTHASLIISVDIVEPSPADAYGYRVYDRYDRDLPCPYDWFELDPGLEGPGVEFTYSNADSGTFLPAPFPLSFYGQSSDTLTVNCNGWMLPGVHHEAGNQDFTIPYSSSAPNAPAGIIAPFWNDLRNGNGNLQYSYYDTASGRWVLQFNNQKLSTPSNPLHNWQVQLLDPVYRPTATGDCDILFLYGVMQLNYPFSSTIGIENPSRSTGIQVIHNTTLSSWSWPIETGAALRFTTGRATQRGQATVTPQLNPPPSDGTALRLVIGGRTVNTTYPTAFVADSVPAAPVSGLLFIDGYEQARFDHHVILPNQMNTMTVDAWRLDPPSNVSATQAGHAVTLRWNSPQSVQFRALPSLRYNVYRNDTLMASAMTDSMFVDEPFPDSTVIAYKVEAVYRYGRAHAPLEVTIGLSAKLPLGTLPTVYQLYPNYPNPFNPDTRIRLDVPATTEGRLEVYDLQGRLVRTLYSGLLTAGHYEYSWNSHDDVGQQVASGLYFCRFASPHFTATQKMMLVK
jgi:hypothetical protein